MFEEKSTKDKALESSMLLSGESPIINLKQTAESQAIYIDQDATGNQALHIESAQYGQSITNAGAGYGLRINEAGNGIALDINKQATGGGNAIDIDNSGTGYDIRGHNGNWLVTKAGVIACVGMTGPNLVGATGVQGQTGIQGVQGVTGTQGKTGVQGDTGIQGGTGIQGVQGVTGLQGKTGVQGASGIQGETGIQGIQGETGIQGIQGEIGIQGVTGPSGDLGSQGETGTCIAKTKVGDWLSDGGFSTYDAGVTGVKLYICSLERYDMIMPFSGSIVAMAAMTSDVSAGISRGYLTIYPVINDVRGYTGLDCRIDWTTNTDYHAVPVGEMTFDAGDVFCVQVDVDSDFDSGTVQPNASMYVVFD
jgi:hypothetical protein